MNHIISSGEDRRKDGCPAGAPNQGASPGLAAEKGQLLTKSLQWDESGLTLGFLIWAVVTQVRLLCENSASYLPMICSFFSIYVIL